MLLLFARVGYVPCLEELLSMGADPASKVAPLSRARGRGGAMDEGVCVRVEIRGGGSLRRREAGHEVLGET